MELNEKDLVYSGKSKDVYAIADGEFAGKYAFVFTDRATGYVDEAGGVHFDPGYDNVVGDIPGKGAIVCRFAKHFFELLKGKDIPSHYIDTISDNVMIVEPADVIGMPAQAPGFEGSEELQNLEWTWRNNATGSFWRRYPFVTPGMNLYNKVVEAWTKGKSDILITYEALEAVGVMAREEIDYAVSLVKDIATVVSEEFASKGLHVIDGKFELGRLKHGDGKIVLIDEISPDVLRVCNGYVPDEEENCTAYLECIQTHVSEDGKRKIKGTKQLTAKQLEEIFLGGK